MLRSFYVRNYKNFKDGITVNFADHGEYQFNNDCIINGYIGKMLIYGRNASGKSNLGSALLDVYSTLFRPYYPSESSFLNADSLENYAEFEYVLRIRESEIIYSYTKSDSSSLRSEKLTINGDSIYLIDFLDGYMEIDNESLGASEAIIQRYREEINEVPNNEDNQTYQLPFLRWVVSNVAIPETSPIQETWNFFRRMTLLTARGMQRYSLRSLASYWEALSRDSNLKKYEQFLNIMGVPCKLALKKLPEGDFHLYFEHDRLLPFYQTASSGTLALDNLYQRIIFRGSVPSLLYFDEFDAYCHYEMSDRLVQYLKQEYPQTQIIFTTHNTNLMTNRLMRPDCLFILSHTGTLTSVRNATQRELREGHNLEKMYISGEFERYE